MPMNTTTWSSTRAKTLNDCPRRYVHQHVLGRGGHPNGERAGHVVVAQAWSLGQRRKAGDLAMRATRVAMMRLLDAWHRGGDVSEAEIRMMVESALASELGSAAGASDPVEDDRMRLLVDRCLEQVSAVRQAPLLSDLRDRRGITEWMRFDGLQPLYIGGMRAYVAPALVVRENGRWSLVRLAMRAAHRVPEPVSRIEAHAMVLWARRQFGLPSDADAYRVVRIAWLGRSWMLWQENGSPARTEEARRLLAHDGRAFDTIPAVPTPSSTSFEHIDAALAPVERASERRHCRNCGYRRVCPGADGLMEGLGPATRRASGQSRRTRSLTAVSGSAAVVTPLASSTPSAPRAIAATTSSPVFTPAPQRTRTVGSTA